MNEEIPMNQNVPLQFEAIGAEWKDRTSYSQGGSRIPKVWQTAYTNGFRIVLARNPEGWDCKTYHPHTEWQPVKLATDINDPHSAALEAMSVVSGYFRRLANSIFQSQ